MSLDDRYGTDEERTLQVCVSHKHMIGLPASDFRICDAHGVQSTDDDIDLLEPVEPVAWLPHSFGLWFLGGRDELLALREAIDDALELIP